MKLLTLKLANWLSRGAFVKSCKAATEWEARYREMSEKAVKLERSLNSTEQHLRSAERALIEKDERINALVDERHRMSEGLDQIIRYGEGKIGLNGNGGLRRAVRMAEGALYPDGEPSLADRIRAVAQENVECRQGEMPL